MVVHVSLPEPAIAQQDGQARGVTLVSLNVFVN